MTKFIKFIFLQTLQLAEIDKESIHIIEVEKTVRSVRAPREIAGQLGAFYITVYRRLKHIK